MVLYQLRCGAPTGLASRATDFHRVQLAGRITCQKQQRYLRLACSGDDQARQTDPSVRCVHISAVRALKCACIALQVTYVCVASCSANGHKSSCRQPAFVIGSAVQVNLEGACLTCNSNCFRLTIYCEMPKHCWRTWLVGRAHESRSRPARSLRIYQSLHPAMQSVATSMAAPS